MTKIWRMHRDGDASDDASDAERTKNAGYAVFDDLLVRLSKSFPEECNLLSIFRIPGDGTACFSF